MTILSSHRFSINKPLASMYARCSISAECTSEYLFGETVICVDEAGNSPNTSTIDNTVTVTVTEAVTGENSATTPPTKPKATPVTSSDWIHVQAERDDYTGYMRRADLQSTALSQWQSSHWVIQRSTLVFTEPSIKSPVLCRLPFLARVHAESPPNETFLKLRTGGYVWATHVLTAKQILQQSALQLAQTHFLGTPYLWGGCSPGGIDCSGLVQALAVAKGIKLPRDSGDQESFLEHTIERQDRQSGDLVYWPGHVGILVDKDTVLHATAHSLSCTQEPLTDVETRAGKLRSIKRLFP